jgi:hypothetical protein
MSMKAIRPQIYEDLKSHVPHDDNRRLELVKHMVASAEFDRKNGCRPLNPARYNIDTFSFLRHGKSVFFAVAKDSAFSGMDAGRIAEVYGEIPLCRQLTRVLSFEALLEQGVLSVTPPQSWRAGVEEDAEGDTLENIADMLSDLHTPLEELQRNYVSTLAT